MAQLRAQFFSGQLSETAQSEIVKPTAISATKVDRPPPPKGPPPSLDRRKSADEGVPNEMKLNALNDKSDIIGMFEENIAIKKGLIPDPNIPQGPVVRMRRKVNPNIKNLQKSAFFKDNDNDRPNKNRESVPIDKKMFSHFMNKFEDDEARQAAKNQLWQLTQEQKNYNQNKSWSQKQEEKRLEDERKILEEITRQEKEARMKAEEEERLRKEEEERQRQIQEEEERKAAEEAAAAAAAAALAEEGKKKKKKKGKNKKNNEPVELPNIVGNTCSDLRRKFQDLKAANEANTKEKTLERPRVRKLIQNPFEKQASATEAEVTTNTVKKREFPNANRLGDIKKRFSQFMSSEPVNIPSQSKNEVTDEQEANKSNVEGTTTDQTDCKKQDNLDKPSPRTSATASPAHFKRKSLLQNSVEALKGSIEKLNNSKERLSDAFQQKKKGTMSSRPSKSDMQSYLISHVLYDGQVRMETVPTKEEEEDDFMEMLEKELRENDIPEEELMNDEYIKGLQKYLSFFDDSTSKKSKKKKKKKKANETVQQQQPALPTVEVSSIKEQFELKKKNAQNQQKENQESIQIKPTVGKFKNMFESNNNDSNQQQTCDSQPVKKRNKMISNELIQKFDNPEMVEELKRHRDEEREKRKQERLKKLEDERLRIEAEIEKARKLEEEKLEKERQEKLRKEEQERREKERIEEEAKRKAAYEEMVKEEKIKGSNQLRKKMREKKSGKYWGLRRNVILNFMTTAR